MTDDRPDLRLGPNDARIPDRDLRELTPTKLEQMMAATFGPDWRNKVLIGPCGVWPLAGVFEECGMRDPRAPVPSSGSYGIFQILPPRR